MIIRWDEKPDIVELEDQYFKLTHRSTRKAFLGENPELTKYWDEKRGELLTKVDVPDNYLANVAPYQNWYAKSALQDGPSLMDPGRVIDIGPGEDIEFLEAEKELTNLVCEGCGTSNLLDLNKEQRLMCLSCKAPLVVEKEEEEEEPGVGMIPRIHAAEMVGVSVGPYVEKRIARILALMQQEGIINGEQAIEAITSRCGEVWDMAVNRFSNTQPPGVLR
jgi:hypothetical protein